MNDVIVYDIGASDRHHALYAWSKAAPIHEITAPDPHRLQVERFVFDNRAQLGRRVMDVGQSIEPRRWVGDGYFTFGLDANADVAGDLTKIPMPDGSVDGVICTEVLEHCSDPFAACREMHRVLKSGGTLVASAPFCWPDHHTKDYPDFWRFTEQGWRRLLSPFASVAVTACEWSDEGRALYDIMRRFEGFGFDGDVFMTTGFMVEAVKE